MSGAGALTRAPYASAPAVSLTQVPPQPPSAITVRSCSSSRTYTQPSWKFTFALYPPAHRSLFCTIKRMSMENKLCDPDAFAACFREVEGSLPATWAPSCSATELHAHLQKPEVGLPTAYVNRKHPKLVYRVLLSRPAVGVTGQPGLVQLVAGHQWTYMQAEVVNALARREIAGLKTVVPPMTETAIRGHMAKWCASAKDMLTPLWHPTDASPGGTASPVQAEVPAQDGAGEAAPRGEDSDSALPPAADEPDGMEEGADGADQEDDGVCPPLGPSASPNPHPHPNPNAEP